MISEAFALVAELAAADVGIPIGDHVEGCWCGDVDEQWFVAINPHQVAHELKRAGRPAAPKLEPFHVYVEFNGWPAGIFGPGGGTIAAGEAANEGTLIAALKRAYAKTTSVSVTKSRAEIEELVRKAGATDILVGDLGSQRRAFIAFALKGRNIRLSVPEPTTEDLPRRNARGHLIRRTSKQTTDQLEQMRRSRWRVLLLVVKAKLELIELGASSVEREFLAQILAPDGRELAEHVLPKLEAFDLHTPLLPAPAGAERTDP